ncbi:uncharacterized protein LOC143103877 isoform X1 [Alosa pseudoharengus]|uniref:uncharacterized protein LOC143103877 isoform X1 n=2 Tax=Alosa pseudoharengus TaxID=34774 RepID=UPI003F8CA52C
MRMKAQPVMLAKVNRLCGVSGFPEDTVMNPEQRMGASGSEDGELYLSENDLTGKVPSAPPLALGTAVLHARVKWPEGHIPRKDFALRKALQTWLRKDLGSAVEIEGLQLEDTTEWATVEIYPSTALDIVLDQQFAQLKLKDSRVITVEFHRDNSQSVTSIKDPEQHAVTETATSTSEEITLPVALTMAIDVQKLAPDIQEHLVEKFSKFNSGANTFTMSGSLPDVDEFFTEFCSTVNPKTNGRGSALQSTLSKANHHMTVPLAHYWYLNQVHRKEMERLKQKYRVRIHSDVSMHVEADKGATSDSLANACQEFAELFQRCSDNLETISLPSVHQDPRVMIDFMKDILREERKLMLNVSAQNWSLFGPEENISTVQKIMDVKANMDDPRVKTKGGNPKSTASMELHKESEGNKPRQVQMPYASVQNVEECVKVHYPTAEKPPKKVLLKEVKSDALIDPLLTDGILMNDIHWGIMTNTFKMQIESIKTRFGVALKENRLKDSVTVRAVGNRASLEVNALRALTSLYQKVVTRAMCCPLQNVSLIQTEMVKMYLSDIREQNPSLAVKEGSGSNGVWMLIGLPDHLRFAVREIEKKLDGPVFDEKHKDMIGFDRHTEFLRPFSDLPAWNGSKGYEGVQWGKGAASGGAIYEDVEEPRGADRGVLEGAGSPFLGKEILKGGNGSKWDKENVCKKVFQKVEGDQPDGIMTHLIKKSTLPGFKRCDTIVITYHIPSGIQSRNHPNPGRRFKGAHLTAYLPAIREGREVLELLRKAFNQKLVFTVGTSQTRQGDYVIWNGIHHKINTHGGPESGGYPDDNYLIRVREELRAKGIE